MGSCSKEFHHAQAVQGGKTHCEECGEELTKVDASPLNLAEAKASLAAIHYHGRRLYDMLNRKDRLEEASIAWSIVKECEDRLPELKQILEPK